MLRNGVFSLVVAMLKLQLQHHRGEPIQIFVGLPADNATQLFCSISSMTSLIMQLRHATAEDSSLTFKAVFNYWFLKFYGGSCQQKYSLHLQLLFTQLIWHTVRVSSSEAQSRNGGLKIRLNVILQESVWCGLLTMSNTSPI